MDDGVPWSSGSRERWLRAVGAWLDEVLTPFGERRESIEPVKERPWGAVLRVRTAARALWFKAVGPGGRHEVRLLGDIAQRSPGLAPDVLSRLEGSGTPRSIDHADIHGWNVVVGAGAPRLIDWGDACITHPFSSLLVPIEWVAGRLPREEQPAAVDRLCDAYLRAWGEGDRDQLGLAVWVGYVARALSNDEQCAGGSAEVIRDGQREIVALLRTWATKADRVDPTELLRPMLDR